MAEITITKGPDQHEVLVWHPFTLSFTNVAEGQNFPVNTATQFQVLATEANGQPVQTLTGDSEIEWSCSDDEVAAWLDKTGTLTIPETLPASYYDVEIMATFHGVSTSVVIMIND